MRRLSLVTRFFRFPTTPSNLVVLAKEWRVHYLDMMSHKESVLDAIRRLPEDIRFKDAIEEIRILQRIELGEKGADEGRVIPHEDVRAMIRSSAGK
jgi:hypothetical protein